jgi:hypothetical protein
MQQSIKRAIAEHFDVPKEIRSIASACAYDLLYGPIYVGFNNPADPFSHDAVSSLPDDLDEYGRQEALYVSPFAERLRDYIENLPSQGYVEDWSETFSETEPEAYEDEDGETIEPSDYWIVDQRQIVEALFGKTIAFEFR